MWNPFARKKSVLFLDDAQIIPTPHCALLLIACKELIYKAALEIRAVLELGRDGTIRKGGFINSERAATDATLEFCLSCMYDAFFGYYDRRDTLALIEALFLEMFDRIPTQELYQRYMTIPLIPKRGMAHIKSGQYGSRAFQFVSDRSGGEFPNPVTASATIIIASQLTLDGRQILKAEDPEVKGRELVESFEERVTADLARIFPGSRQTS